MELDLLGWIEIALMGIAPIMVVIHFAIGFFRYVFAAKGINFFYSFRWCIILVAVVAHHGYAYYGWTF